MLIGSHTEDFIYSTPITVEFAHLDVLARPKPSAWLGWLIGAAGYDYSLRGYPRNKLLDANQVFLVSRISYHVYQIPKVEETLTLSTWEHGVETIYFNRNYEVTNAKGNIIADASSVWLLCNPQTHRILRPSALLSPLRANPRDIQSPVAQQIPLFESETPCATYRVQYSDLDGNGHLFSVNYGDIVLDLLPEDIRNQAPRDFTINYIKEAKLNEVLTIYQKREQNAFTLLARHQDGAPCFSALVTY